MYTLVLLGDNLFSSVQYNESWTTDECIVVYSGKSITYLGSLLGARTFTKTVDVLLLVDMYAFLGLTHIYMYVL